MSMPMQFKLHILQFKLQSLRIKYNILQVYYEPKKKQLNKTGKILDAHKTRSQTQSPALIDREIMGHIEKERCDGNLRTSVNQSLRRKKPYNDPQKQTYSGDLLDRHPTSFTSANKPFKPRLLRKPSKSFLSKYRYYMAPTKKSPQRTTSVQGNRGEEKTVYR